MISNEELVAKVEESKERPNCFTVALIGATSPTVENPTPTAAANTAKRHGLSKEDIQRARWIAMYLKRGLGDGFTLLEEFFESERKQKVVTQEENTVEDTITEERAMVDRDLLMIALGLKGTLRDRDALAIAVVLEKTLRELKSKKDAGELEFLPDPLPEFTISFTDQSSGTKSVVVALNKGFYGLCIFVGHDYGRGHGGTNFSITSLSQDALKRYQHEISGYLQVPVEDYSRTVEFIRSAITMIPYMLSQKRMAQ